MELLDHMVVKETQSCPTLCDPMNRSLLASSVPGDSPGENTGVGCCSLLQGIFPTQGSNPCLLHWRWILYCWAIREAVCVCMCVCVCRLHLKKSIIKLTEYFKTYWKGDKNKLTERQKITLQSHANSNSHWCGPSVINLFVRVKKGWLFISRPLINSNFLNLLLLLMVFYFLPLFTCFFVPLTYVYKIRKKKRFNNVFNLSSLIRSFLYPFC